MSDVEVTAEEEKIRDRRGFEAIAEIHKEMDDDHSGSIDRTESSGVRFLFVVPSRIFISTFFFKDEG